MNVRSLSLSKPAQYPLIAEPKALGVAGFACVWLAGVYVLLKVAPTLYELTMLLSILTVLVMPLAYKYVENDLDIFEPLVFANLSLASMFLGRPLFDLNTNTWLHEWFSTFFDARPGFDDMLFYALLGIVALQVGYLSSLPRRIASRLPGYARGVNPERMVVIAWIMFLAGVVLFEEYIRQSGGIAFLVQYLTSRTLEAGYSFKTASGYLFIGPLFWPPAGMISLSAWLQTKKPAHLFVTIFFFICFFTSMLGGVARSFTIQGILGVVTIWYVGRDKRPAMLFIAPVVIVMLLFFVYDREARRATSLSGKEITAEKILAHPIEGLETIWSEDDAAMCDYFSIIVANVPTRVGYRTGSTITDVLLRAYPRFLAPNNQKPDEHTVFVFKTFFPAVYYEYASGASPSLFGELYVDHGGVAIVVYMLFFGAILGVPKQWMSRSKCSVPSQLLFVAMPAYTISLMRGGVPAFVEYVAITSISIFLIDRYAQKQAISV